MTLRRVVAQRVRTIKEAHQLTELQLEAKPKRDLELLCLMFADMVWYFLRSTDPIVRIQVESLLFEPPGTDVDSEDFHPAVELRFKSGDLSELPTIRAWLYPSGLTHEDRNNWIRIENGNIASYPQGDPPRLPSGQEVIILKSGIAPYEGPPRVTIHGELRGNDEQMKLIYDRYFKSYY
jgi:hypothetical protein